MTETKTPEPTLTASGEAVLRVADRDTGHHYTIAAASYDSARHRLLKSPAVDSYGDPAAPKFKASASADDERYTGSDETQEAQ